MSDNSNYKLKLKPDYSLTGGLNINLNSYMGIIPANQKDPLRELDKMLSEEKLTLDQYNLRKNEYINYLYGDPASFSRLYNMLGGRYTTSYWKSAFYETPPGTLIKETFNLVDNILGNEIPKDYIAYKDESFLGKTLYPAIIKTMFSYPYGSSVSSGLKSAIPSLTKNPALFSSISSLITSSAGYLKSLMQGDYSKFSNSFLVDQAFAFMTRSPGTKDWHKIVLSVLGNVEKKEFENITKNNNYKSNSTYEINATEENSPTIFMQKKYKETEDIAKNQEKWMREKYPWLFSDYVPGNNRKKTYKHNTGIKKKKYRILNFDTYFPEKDREAHVILENPFMNEYIDYGDNTNYIDIREGNVKNTDSYMKIPFNFKLKESKPLPFELKLKESKSAPFDLKLKEDKSLNSIMNIPLIENKDLSGAYGSTLKLNDSEKKTVSIYPEIINNGVNKSIDPDLSPFDENNSNPPGTLEPVLRYDEKDKQYYYDWYRKPGYIPSKIIDSDEKKIQPIKLKLKEKNSDSYYSSSNSGSNIPVYDFSNTLKVSQGSSNNQTAGSMSTSGDSYGVTEGNVGITPFGNINIQVTASSGINVDIESTHPRVIVNGYS